jgi:hypothetical protein
MIGEGQDIAEVMEVGKKLHDIYSLDDEVDPNYLRYLGQLADDLSRPKKTNN